MTWAGLVLAAGAGTRLGRPKAEVVHDGRRLLDVAVQACRDAGLAPSSSSSGRPLPRCRRA